MLYQTRIVSICLILLLLSANLMAQSIEYSPDGQTLAVNWKIDFSVGQDFSQILLFDVKSSKLKSSLTTEELSNRMLFSADAKTLIIAERLLLEKYGFNETGELIKLKNGNSIENFALDRKFQDEINSDFLSLALSPDGKTIYKLYPNFLNAYTFPELKHLPAQSRALELKGEDEPQNNFIGISRDSRFVVEAELNGENSRLIIKEIGQAPAKIEMPKYEKEWSLPRLSATISQNNATLMLRMESQMNQKVQIGFLDLKTRKFIGNLLIPMIDDNNENEFYPLEEVAISPDGKKAAARFDAVDENAQDISTIAIFDIVTKETSYIKVKSEVGLIFAESIAFSPDSKKMATLSSVLSRASFSPRIEIWNAEDGKKINQFE